MKTTEEKLAVLSAVAHELNRRSIVWAVGASLLLYFRRIVPDFHDIDLMVREEDADRLRDALLSLGELLPGPGEPYKTRCFLRFLIDGVEVDAIGGMVITRSGVDYDCPFTAEHVAGYATVNGERIPLQSLSDWRSCYELMGRTEKVELIDRHKV